MVDMLDPRLRRPYQRHGMVDGVDPHQGNVADAIANASIAHLSPEPLVVLGIGRRHSIRPAGKDGGPD